MHHFNENKKFPAFWIAHTLTQNRMKTDYEWNEWRKWKHNDNNLHCNFQLYHQWIEAIKANKIVWRFINTWAYTIHKAHSLQCDATDRNKQILNGKSQQLHVRISRILSIIIEWEFQSILGNVIQDILWFLFYLRCIDRCAFYKKLPREFF